LPDYVAKNVELWSGDEEYLVSSGRRAWASEEIWWGVWRVPETELGVLPDVAGLDVVELGCGTAYFSSRTSTLLVLCSPDERPAQEALVRPQFGLHRIEWPEGGVEFQIPHGELIRLLRESGFEVEDLIEIQAPDDVETHLHYDYVTAEWGKRWPAEEIWKARRR
jgi:hypothetical protein